MSCWSPRALRVTLRGSAAAVLLALLAGCGSTGHRAPVEDRGARPAPQAPAPAPTPAAAGVVVTPVAPAASAADAGKPPPPGAENAGKPGYFSVRPGDTMIRIGLETGQNWRDIARWNNIDNPNVIEVGQVLRVAPPAPDPNAAVTKPVLPAGRVDGRPLGASAPTGSASAAPAPAANTAPASGARDGEEDLGWMWPAAGGVIGTFDENRSKGLEIAGKAGDPVVAAADGRVVYAGSGLRGYGNLIIVKHNANYLSAYAHNQSLLVKEDQVVRKGQKIAEMGSSDAERVQLHFEIRRQGKPIDPARLLPPR